jgi:ribonucleoside-diphosphate reductase alpha chain
VKSLYYCRSKSVQRAQFAQGEELRAHVVLDDGPKAKTDYDECLACQ